MIITRTPMRLTLGGGGTDLPAYACRYGGFVFAAALDKYMYVSVNRPAVDDLVRLKYSRSETVEHRDQLRHEIARECLRLAGIERGIEVASMADIPAGTGLGSSGCYAVGLLHALHALHRSSPSLTALAEQACSIEMEVLGRPTGKQDPYIAALGGLTVLDIRQDGKVAPRPARLKPGVLEELQRNLLLFYTGVSRPSAEVLAQVCGNSRSGNGEAVESLHRIREIGFQILEAVETGALHQLGLLFDEHWEAKKRLSGKVSSPFFDQLYTLAKENGALGGKIAGAGGGGFFACYTESQHARLRQAMLRAGLKELRYRFDFEGSKILADFRDGTAAPARSFAVAEGVA